MRRPIRNALAALGGFVMASAIGTGLVLAGLGGDNDSRAAAPSVPESSPDTSEGESSVAPAIEPGEPTSNQIVSQVAENLEELRASPDFAAFVIRDRTRTLQILWADEPSRTVRETAAAAGDAKSVRVVFVRAGHSQNEVLDAMGRLSKYATAQGIDVNEIYPVDRYSTLRAMVEASAIAGGTSLPELENAFSHASGLPVQVKVGGGSVPLNLPADRMPSE